jgi:hypothetical protein
VRLHARSRCPSVGKEGEGSRGAGAAPEMDGGAMKVRLIPGEGDRWAPLWLPGCEKRQGQIADPAPLPFESDQTSTSRAGFRAADISP